MSEVPISSPYRSTPEEPVSDDERNRVSARINAAFTDGAIDGDDYRARLDALFAARRLGDLLPVVEGLPPMTTYANPAIVTEGASQTGPGELAPARSGTQLTLVVGVGLGVVVLLVVVLLAVVFLR